MIQKQIFDIRGVVGRDGQQRLSFDRHPIDVGATNCPAEALRRFASMIEARAWASGRTTSEELAHVASWGPRCSEELAHVASWGPR